MPPPNESAPITSCEEHMSPLQLESKESIAPPESHSSSTYEENSSKDLTVFSCAALILADCMGTGILALPHEVRMVLGDVWGVAFVLLNLPINLYAGFVLSESAKFVEEGGVCAVGGGDSYGAIHHAHHHDHHDDEHETHHDDEHENNSQERQTYDFISLTSSLFGPNSFPKALVLVIYYTNLVLVLGNYILVMSHSVRAVLGESTVCIPVAGLIASTLMYGVSQFSTMAELGRTATVASLLSLFIVVLQCLYALDFEIQPDPLLHDVDSLNSTNSNVTHHHDVGWGQRYLQATDQQPSLLRQMAALSSIGFAVGSQKLLLNIRHEMRNPAQAPTSLAIALFVFGAAYILVIQLSGSTPPSFLLDSIQQGSTSRKIAGGLLWCHVAVSYAINSQALCRSLDRLWFHQFVTSKLTKRVTSPQDATIQDATTQDVSQDATTQDVSQDSTQDVTIQGITQDATAVVAIPKTTTKANMYNTAFARVCTCCSAHTLRWVTLTFLTSLSSYLIANAIPFFADLVSLIGALTSVPLTLLLPAILYRKVKGVPLVCPPSKPWLSYGLVVFSSLFLGCGLMGAISSIELDWKGHGPPFACDG